MSIRGISLALLGLLALACTPAPDVEAPESAAEAHIAWFEGTVGEAFALAREQGRPVFLYWGAEWCPPCHYLKNKIFKRPEFVARSRQFICVYLDGDTERAQILGEELELPNIEPRGQAEIVSERDRYTGIRHVGPESLRHFKRTYRQALRRQIAAGLYDPDDPVVIPVREDRRYRAWKVNKHPEYRAVIVYMMDVSGSMGSEQKEIVRIESIWIDTWLRSQYKGLDSRFIIHDATAKEVDRDTFFRTRESGGTMISSAYKKAAEIIDQDYPPEAWNIYLFHFSDGDNWSADDTMQCVKLLREEIIPASNVFCYGQVESPYGSGQFIKDLRSAFGDEELLVTSEIKSKEDIMDSILDFLKGGR